MGNVLIPAAGYLPLLAWLLLITVAGLSRRTMPLWTVPAAALAAVGVNAAVNGLLAAAVATAAMLAVVAVLFFIGLLTRASLMILPVALAGLPVLAWIALVPGYAAAGLVSAVRLRQAAGAGYLNMLAGETVAAIGADMAQTKSPLGVSAPDLSRIPLADADAPAGTLSARVSAVKVRLSAWLAAGVALTALLAAWLAR